MLPRSGKNKAVRLQNAIRDILYEMYPKLRPGDIKTAVMGESGIDIILSPTAQDMIPFDIEAKNTERLNLWDSIAQAEANAVQGRIPLVVFKRNRSEIYAIIKFDHLLEL